MQVLPVRLFHASLSGIVMGLMLTLFFFHIQNRFRMSGGNLDRITDMGPISNPTPSPVPSPVAADPPFDPNDSDGDGIPNEWELLFHHDPDNVADAAADFDNDGLTARQEYQLHSGSNGASGNPLGRWASESLHPPEDLEIRYLYPQDINSHGEVLINGGLTTDGVDHDGSILVDAYRNWTVIRHPDSSSADFIWCSDLNDMGEVAGSWYSYDWTASEGFVWSAGNGYQLLEIDGRKAFPASINNRGDWVGSVVDENQNWHPAYVVNGVNIHSDRDWWPYVWYQDVNDFGEALGSYYSAGYQTQHAFLACGLWIYDTGLEGAAPEFDPGTYSWSYTVAMNSWGEFTAGAGGRRDGIWSYPGYVFDGGFREIQNTRLAPYYVYPSAVSDDKTVAGNAYDESWRSYGFIHRDGVTLRIEDIIPEADGSYGVFMSGNRRMVSAAAGGQAILVITPDQDRDGDGMPDDWEDFYGLNKASAADATSDPDGDGTNNLGEFLLRSDPSAPPAIDASGVAIDLRPGIDTDGDGIPNVWEWKNGLAYDDPTDAPLDYDRDGYSNLQEFQLNTDPRGAPSYRMRVIGPFPGAASAFVSSAVLGDGQVSGVAASFLGGNVAETAYFSARPSSTLDGSQRPAAWSVLRGETTGAFVFATRHGSALAQQLAQAPSGASLCQISATPSQFVFWSSPSAQPITLSGAANQNDAASLSNVRISPSGTFVAGTRQLASTTSTYQPVVWKMPISGTASFRPIPLIPPAGVTLSPWASFFVNDAGHVVANGQLAGQSCPVLWQVSANATSATASILPPLPSGLWASASGISNQQPPLICGTSRTSTGNTRAVVWTANGSISDLGTLPSGNTSSASVISRGGLVAGISNVLSNNTLRQQVFLASFDATSASWKLQPQGEPLATNPVISSLNDSGEILGTVTISSPVSRQTVRTLWRHGRAHAIESCLTHASGATLDNVTQLSPHGTLLGSVWKDGARLHVLLTPDRDVDADGLPDAFENQHGLNAFAKNLPGTDSDSDGLSDLDEFRNGTDPRNPDTDTDGMRDGWEISWGLLPHDPTDAALDPDGDRVPNLRESQIGTTPTGIYKVDTRLTDTAGVSPTVLAADDAGNLVLPSVFQYSSSTDAQGFQIQESSQQMWLHPAGSGSPLPLPAMVSHYRSNGDWTQYEYSSSYHTYALDPASGLVHGSVQRTHSTFNGTNHTYRFEHFLVPDAAHTPDESAWIPWADVQSALQQQPSPILAANESLNSWPDAVSPGGSLRIHSSTLQSLRHVLDYAGNHVRTLPGGTTWQYLNDQGDALALSSRYIPAANGQAAYYQQEIRLNNGGSGFTTHPLPRDPAITTQFSILRFSNDRKVVLSRSERTEQLASITRHYLFDPHSGTLARTRQPGLGSEAIMSLSPRNARLLGSGPKPFHITPDGTCIRLDALRIRNSATDSPQPFATLYPKTLTPAHISSDGRITLTTTNTRNQTLVLQITPHNDTDGDGMPDDWETSHYLANPDDDGDGDGISNAQEFAARLDPTADDRKIDNDQDGLDNAAELTMGTEINNPDTDGDGMTDGYEVWHRFSPLVIEGGTKGPNGDFDADGLSNRIEAAAGRIATLRNEYFPLNPTQASTGGMTAKWFGSSGFWYTIQYSSNLMTWTNHPMGFLGENKEIAVDVAAWYGTPLPPMLFARLYVASAASSDLDGDGLSAAAELSLGLDPTKADSNGDGNPDGTDDSDGDGLTNAQEAAANTDPAKADTDGDSIPDGDEIASGHDPRSNQSFPPRWVSTSRYGATMATPPFIHGSWEQLARTFSGTVTVASFSSRLPALSFPKQIPDTEWPIRGFRIGLPEAGGNAFGTYSSGHLSQCRFWLETKPAKDAEIRMSALKVTKRYHRPTFASPRVESEPQVEVVEVVIPANRTQSIPQDLLPEINESLAVGEEREIDMSLVPVDLISDLNNDGQITAADNPLRDAAMASGATDEIKDKGTEFLFVNDQLSNGLWDGDDSDPERPVAEKDDDDAQEIKINPGITEGEVWLEHPAIAGLSFYETKECTGAKVNLYPASRYPVSPSNPFPDQLFIRADGTLTFPTANPQIEGDLVLKIKAGGANGQEIEAVKMKLTVVKDFGAKAYFQAANDYVLENNTELFVHEKAYDSVLFRLCLMREEGTQVLPLELYEPAKDNWIQAGGIGNFSAYTYREAAGISEVMINDPDMTVVINGNQCGFTSGLSSAEAAVMSALGDPQITDKCQGRLKELNAAQSPVSNDHFDENTNIPGTLMKGSALAGPDPLPGTTPPQAGGKYIAQYPDGKVVVGLNFAPDFSAPPNPSYILTQMGGLSTSYNSSDRSNYNNSVVGTAPIGSTDKKMVFVVMGKNGTVGKGKTVELYNSAVSSGVPQIPGATTPTGSSAPITMTFLDSGVTSCALAYKKQNGNLSLLYKGSKHNGSPYYTNTFLRFKSSKPRP